MRCKYSIVICLVIILNICIIFKIMDNFELDITQYTTRDLEKVYTLPNDYDIANIEDKYDYFARKY